MINQRLFFNGDISDWDVSNALDMSHMFKEARSLNKNKEK